ncbi:MAG: tetratricopeptide repeat protein [Bacteroidetes bacterium]|nr:tetratricopeptide repeat protein [Bacteroidota bacterium]
MPGKSFLLVLVFAVFWQSASASFDFNANCVDAYNAILSLKMTEARQLIQKEKQHNPGNGITILLDNYIDYFSLLASDSKAEYEKLKDHRSDRLSALEDYDKNSPYYLFCQAEVYLQWGLLKGRFGDYFSSAMDLRSANGLLHDNAEKYPAFLPDQKDLALINVVFGSLPSNLKSISRFVGMKGDSRAGLKQLENLRTELPKTKYSYYNNEVIFFLCQMNIDVLHNYGSYPALMSYLQGMDDKSLLKAYLQGYVAAKTAHNDEAISFLQKAPESAGYIEIPLISYLLGNAKLNRMDNDADEYLLKYIRDYRGVNYIKDSYLKLAYYYLLQNDAGKYNYYLNLVRTKGYVSDEKDKQALREANDARPDLTLLKARFFFDGGYYDKALAQLKSKKPADFKLLRDRIEYAYRLGRVYDKTDQTNEAIINYLEAIRLGKSTSYYYAANAALNTGRIFEQKRDFKRAGYYYNQALDMHDHEYQSSIDNDAKEGLKRIGQ